MWLRDTVRNNVEISVTPCAVTITSENLVSVTWCYNNQWQSSLLTMWVTCTITKETNYLCMWLFIQSMKIDFWSRGLQQPIKKHTFKHVILQKPMKITHVIMWLFFAGCCVAICGKKKSTVKPKPEIKTREVIRTIEIPRYVEKPVYRYELSFLIVVNVTIELYLSLVLVDAVIVCIRSYQLNQDLSIKFGQTYNWFLRILIMRQFSFR